MNNLNSKRFVIQEHHASKLHWDFRLEVRGVLKSWAVPKGISIIPKVKRLAVEVEDHTLNFLHFEGEISEGEYGAGKIFIWDKGEYDLSKLEKRRIEFVLHGKKVSGKHILLHWKNKDWLLMKV